MLQMFPRCHLLSLTDSLNLSSFSSSGLYGAATPKRLEIALPVIKKEYVAQVKDMLNTKGYHNRSTGSKVTLILRNCWIMSVGEVALGRVYSHPAKQACLVPGISGAVVLTDFSWRFSDYAF